MNYIADCLERFRQLPQKLKDRLGGPETLAVVKALEEDYGVSTSFVIILVAFGELSPNDIDKYLQAKYGLSAEDAFDIMNELTREVLTKILIEADDTEPDKESLRIILQNKLDLLLKDKDEAEAFNDGAFQILSLDGSFLQELETVLINNQLIIGSKPIDNSVSRVSPTVANWIKDFVSLNGTDNFDDLIVANYLINSKNVKNLTEDEKKSLSQVLKIYRNLVFFLENSEKLPVDFWEIIPVAKEETALLNSNKPEKKVETPVINDILSSQTAVAAGRPQESETASLQAALKDYSPASLEYRAIKQEIQRLHQGKK